MGKEPVQPQDKYIIRFPDGMRDRIRASAEANNRSMNAEIVKLIEEGYELRAEKEWLEAQTIDYEAEREIIEAQIAAYEEEENRKAETQRAIKEIREEVRRLGEMFAEFVKQRGGGPVEMSNEEAFDLIRKHKSERATGKKD